ncbi:MAG TPA: S8 family serine peptidase [Thermoanaerobaculia bacterium]|jgi:subtilisin family serine protease
MHRLPLLLLSFLVIAQPAFTATRNRDLEPAARERAEGREVIVEPRHPLVPQERAALAALGAKVLSPLPNGRYLVRLAPGVTLDANDPRVAAVRPVTLDMKIDHRIARELRGRAFGRVNVFFHEDVPFAEARETIAEVGGSLANPLALDYVAPGYLIAQVPAAAIQTLARDGRVRMLRAPLKLKLQSNNVVSAAVSKVTEVQAAPYSLSGNGVVVSVHELGAAFNHNDYGGRFTPHFTGGDDVSHATHVIGTIIGSGAGYAPAKGMAPQATVHEYEVGALEEYLEQKQTALKEVGSVADNNSWGYTLGWESSGASWVWWGGAEYHGAYFPEITSGIDQAARRNPILFVHSAGNDGDDTGPLTAPQQHKHVDEENDVKPEIYCYSQDGTGNDCPTPCTPGPQYCEVERHLTSAPFQVIGLTAGAKNVVAIGSVDAERAIAGYSARGPARDGRVKPDLVARGGLGITGQQVVSTWPGNQYTGLQGTSMATPVVTGVAALLTEQYRKSFGGATPNGTTLKALLIAGADDLYTTGPDYTSGHGLVNARASADLIIADATSGSRLRTGQLTQGQQVEIPVRFDGPGKLKVVLVWSDPEIIFFDEEELDGPALVNDLDLKVIGPGGQEILPYVLDKTQPMEGATRGVNHLDNTEVVEVLAAAPGIYRIIARASALHDTREPAQAYVLVSNGVLGATAPPCTDIQEPNNTVETAYGLLSPLQLVNGGICAEGDVDYYRFRVERAGPVNVAVTAGATPVRATLFNGALPLATVDVPAGETRTLQTSLSAGIVPTDLLLRVEATGAIVAPSTYTVTPSFNYNIPVRRRTTRP